VKNTLLNEGDDYMEKLINIFFKMVITILAICVAIITVPLAYIIGMLYVVCISMVGCDFIDMFKYLNGIIKELLIETYKSAKDFWSL
jgi:hypothetical protein